MTISLDDTVLAVRRHFRDVAWSNSTLKEWIKDAVREYSNHFPVLAAFSESAADGVYEYDFFPGAHAEENLPVVFGVVEFEYPTGEDPPEYPLRMSHTDKRFFNSGESYYDIVLHPAMNNGEIWLSSPETGDSFQVKYLTAHSWTEVESGADETCQVPAHHQPLLVQYVTWLCTREMLAAGCWRFHPRRTFFHGRLRGDGRHWMHGTGAAGGARRGGAGDDPGGSPALAGPQL
jgi:hypothetical protein